MADAIKFESPLQERVYRRLKMIGPGAAAFFADAHRIMRQRSTRLEESDESRRRSQAETLETAHHLVGHCLREVESAVRAVLLPSDQRRKKDKEKEHERQVRAILGDLGIPEVAAAAKYWLSLGDRESPDSLFKRTHRNSLGPPRPVDAELESAWQSMQVLLDILLDRFEARYAKVFDRLDELASVDKPNTAHLAELKENVPHTPATHRHFFGKLTSAEWLKPLTQDGFFRDPPPPLEEEGRISYPDWPQAEYLERVVSIKPKEVREIVGSVKTRNALLQAKLLGIALQLPAAEAARLVPVVRAWVPDLLQIEFYDPVIKFIEFLSNEGHGTAAMRLAAELYGVGRSRGE